MVLKIERSEHETHHVLVLSGRIESDEVQTLKACMDDGPVAALDLTQVQLVNLDAVRFLVECESRGIELHNGSPHVRAWIFVERARLGALDSGKEYPMDRMLVVVFENEAKAYQGKSALNELDREGSLTLYASAVILKHADGSVSVKEEQYAAPLGTLVGTPVGSLIGLLGGPVGFAVGALGGFMIGGLVDLDNARIGEDYVADIGRALTPNKVALVAEVDEQWTTPADTKMEALGGTVFRRALWEVRDTVDDEEIAAMKSDLAQYKAEIQQANADRKKKLQAKIDALQAKIQAREQTLKERHEARKAHAKAKKEVLKNNAAAVGRALKELATTPV